MPNIPTRLVLHGWAAIHWMTVRRSLRSTSGYSSVASPPEDPVPRRSTRTTANPPSSAKRTYESA